MSPCPFGINGGEFPDWPVERIVELAVKVGAQFVELPASRLAGADAAHAREAASAAGLAIHVNGLVSALPAAFASARAVQAPYLVVGDDAIERTDASRAESFAAFRATVLALLEAPAHRTMRLALENSIIKVTRRPEDLGELVAEVGHPRFGVNFDAGQLLQRGHRALPVRVRAAQGPHPAPSRQRLRPVHPGGPRPRQASAPPRGRERGLRAAGVGRRELGRTDRTAPEPTVTGGRSRSSPTRCRTRWRRGWKPTPPTCVERASSSSRASGLGFCLDHNATVRHRRRSAANRPGIPSRRRGARTLEGPDRPRSA